MTYITPQQINWEILFAMHSVPKGQGYGDKWSHFDAGRKIVIRHSDRDSQVYNDGIVALMNWLGI